MNSPEMVWIEAILGCMWSGKSEELASRLKSASFRRKKILVILPKKDNRKKRNLGTMLRESSWLGDYNNLYIHKVETFEETKKLLSDVDPDILVLDEIHMFGLWPADFVSELRFIERYQKRKLRVIVSGLDMDFQGKSFEAIALIMAMAHDVRKVTHAICTKCKDKTAYMTYKLPDKNNEVNQDRIQVGGEGDYEARCWECYLLGEGKPV